MKGTILFLLALVNSSNVLACRTGVYGIPEKVLETTDKHFQGVVTGIRLKQFEENLLEVDDFSNGFPITISSAGTQPYEVRLRVIETKKGNASKIETVELFGCGMVHLKLMDVADIAWSEKAGKYYAKKINHTLKNNTNE